MNSLIFENHVGEKSITYSGSSCKQTPWLRNGHVKIQSLYMEVEKNGFLKAAVIRTVCLQECLLRELPL